MLHGQKNIKYNLRFRPPTLTSCELSYIGKCNLAVTLNVV